MTTFKEKCQQYFGTTDFYEVLSVSSHATEKELKKAYHRLSLLVHPDRVDENQKEMATEKFKVLGKIHSILQDKNKRKTYDDCGDFDEESDELFNWVQYWTKMFKKIEISDIEKYEKEYIGSERERLDLKRAYEGTKGDMGMILEMVPFSNCESEPRFIEIVREMVDKEEVPEHKAFFNESKAKKLRRHRKWEAERKEADQVDMEELTRQLDANSKKRAESFSNLINSIEAKYGPKNKKARQALTDGTEKQKAAPTKKSTRRTRAK